jgi:hypothetical protein
MMPRFMVNTYLLGRGVGPRSIWFPEVLLFLELTTLHV